MMTILWVTVAVMVGVVARLVFEVIRLRRSMTNLVGAVRMQQAALSEMAKWVQSLEARLTPPDPRLALMQSMVSPNEVPITRLSREVDEPPAVETPAPEVPETPLAESLILAASVSPTPEASPTPEFNHSTHESSHHSISHSSHDSVSSTDLGTMSDHSSGHSSGHHH